MEIGNLLQSAKLDLNPEVTCAQPMLGKVFRRNRRHIRITGLPDQKPEKKTSFKTTTTAAKKSVRWSDDVHVTVNAETAYTLATQGMQFFQQTETLECNPTPPIAAPVPPVPPPAPPSVPAAPESVPTVAESATQEAELLNAATDEEDNQSHLSDSDRREGNAEASLLTPDEQVTSVVSQTLKTHPKCSPTPAPKRSRQKRKKVTRLCYDSSGCQLMKK